MKLKTNAFALRATRVAHFATGASLLAAVAMALMLQTMQAQNLIIDNFATGGGKVAATTGVQTVTQTGTGIYGGFRQITLTVQNGLGVSTDPYQQPVQAQVRPSNSASDPSHCSGRSATGPLPGSTFTTAGAVLRRTSTLTLPVTTGSGSILAG